MSKRIPKIRTYRRGSKWWVRFHWKGTDYRWSAGESEREADTLGARIILSVTEDRFTGRLVDVDPSQPADTSTTIAPKCITFGKLCDRFLDRHVSHKRSERFYRYTVAVVRRGFESKLQLPVDRITREDVEDFVAARRSEVKTATVNRALRVLKMILARAVEWGYLERSPADRIRLERERNRREFFLTREQLELLMGHAPDWLQALILAATYTGGRRGELLGLTWDDVDLRGRTVRFRDTKGGEDRSVPVSQRLHELLSELPSRFQGGYVFLSASGPGPVKPGRIEVYFNRAVRAAGLYQSVGGADGQRRKSWLHFHDLRHTYASWQVQAGTPLNTVRELLGHKSLTMTLRYSHLAPEHLQQAAGVLDRLDGLSETRTKPAQSGDKGRD